MPGRKYLREGLWLTVQGFTVYLVGEAPWQECEVSGQEADSGRHAAQAVKAPGPPAKPHSQVCTQQKTADQTREPWGDISHLNFNREDQVGLFNGYWLSDAWCILL